MHNHDKIYVGLYSNKRLDKIIDSCGATNLSFPKFSDSTDSRSRITSYRGQQYCADLYKLQPFRVSKRLVSACTGYVF